MIGKQLHQTPYLIPYFNEQRQSAQGYITTGNSLTVQSHIQHEHVKRKHVTHQSQSKYSLQYTCSTL
jgi:hypothetical protein